MLKHAKTSINHWASVIINEPWNLPNWEILCHPQTPLVMTRTHGKFFVRSDWTSFLGWANVVFQCSLVPMFLDMNDGLRLVIMAWPGVLQATPHIMHVSTVQMPFGKCIKCSRQGNTHQSIILSNWMITLGVLGLSSHYYASSYCYKVQRTIHGQHSGFLCLEFLLCFRKGIEDK